MQLLDTLPVCRDFKYGECKRTSCKYIHLLDGTAHFKVPFRLGLTFVFVFLFERKQITWR